MNFNWEDYLSLARRLRDQNTNPDESALRSAVSRAFFSAFCKARNFGRDNENLQVRGNVDDYGIVIAHFSKGKRAKVGTLLGELRQWRNLCDYSDSVNNLHTLATQALFEAQKAIDILKT